ncbi:hypothetical protein AWJ20_1813 [Sugiyamaella lignohabitans]|uniref:Myosin-binding domain-containing protein n=1 Tax=Sugiyamaella lignohabitans TaxID=796027 RepID=A0A167E0W2_9ASCO|nr:uncharacterized protein AWJ20_1813 [Sugiyamaella lignohabitans]ANB13518.1 hypothetical protein AWJ20_1813 [Sugiyamaella lignohabitans]
MNMDLETADESDLTGSPDVFHGTPLGDYLSDAGMSDWGIDDGSSARQSIIGDAGFGDAKQAILNDNDFYQSDDDDKDQSSRFDTKEESIMRGRIIAAASIPFPLSLSAGGMSLPQVRKQKFFEIIRNALKPQLNGIENTKFLERFRYILISSQLLESTTTSMVANHNIDPVTRQKLRKQNILFGDHGPWETLKMQRKYWSGGGGCIVVIVTLLSWQMKKAKQLRHDPKDGNNSATYYRCTCGLIVILCTFLFLFGHSRRRALRMLRAKTIAYASHFVENNLSFDVAVSKCLSLIQEVDLLSMGYQPSLADASVIGSRIPGSRLMAKDNIKQMRTAKSLRSAVSSSLYLAITAYLDAIKECLGCCSELDLQRYFDIYELQGPQQEFSFVMNDDFVGFTNTTGWGSLAKEVYYGSNGGNVSLKFLRNEFKRLHFLRRAFICCLISASASGECTRQELGKWGKIVDHVESCSGLMMRLSTTISRNNLLPIVENNSSDAFLDPKVLSRVSKLNALTASLQHIQARLHFLSEETENFDLNYEQMGEEINGLLSTWKASLAAGDSNAMSTFKRKHLQNASTCTEATLIEDQSLESGLFGHEPKLSDFDDNSSSTSMDESVRQSYGPIRDTGPSSRSTSTSSMTILEGIVGNEGTKRVFSQLPRQARLSLMRQQRELEAERKSVRAQRDNFVLELGSVLDQRKAHSNQ